MTEEKTPELLPCPFCGAKATINRMERSSNFYRCECSHCDVRTGWMFGNGAISIWNTRVYPQEVIEDYFRKLLSVNCECGAPIIADKKICPKCGRNWSDYE